MSVFVGSADHTIGEFTRCRNVTIPKLRQGSDVHLFRTDCNSHSLLLETLPEAILIRNAMGTLLSSVDGSVYLCMWVKKRRRREVCGREKEKLNDRK